MTSVTCALLACPAAAPAGSWELGLGCLLSFWSEGLHARLQAECQGDCV